MLVGLGLATLLCTSDEVESYSFEKQFFNSCLSDILLTINLMSIGDFQWPKMRISAEEWHVNTARWLEPGELLYIATDETNRTWFEPLTKNYRVRFLDDFSELADLSNLDPNYVGMIDQVVASRSNVFVGTYFSSFSAFIGRMRAYHGLSGKKMYYSHPNYWNETHSWGEKLTDFMVLRIFGR